MNVLSLFDGMSCGQIALSQLGKEVEIYYASEVDKYGIAVTQHNFPNTVQLGDVTKWKEWDIDWSTIDLIQGGSPCQGFSFAGKQLAFDDPRSALFFVFVDILNHIKSVNPNVKFLLENVRMKKEYLDVISEYMGVQPVMINSALVSAQNRVRYYWTNIAEIEQPEDRGILLRDILETETEEKLVPINQRNAKNFKTGNQKSVCLLASSYKGAGNDGTTLVNRCIQVGEADLKGHDILKRVYSPDGKAPTLNANGRGNLEPKVIIERLGNVNPSGNGMNGEVYGINGKSPTVTTNKGEGSKISTLEKNQWRKLTPKECERLQTVPDEFTLVPYGNRMMSNSQRYKMLGNGWTVEVIKHIYKNL